VISGFLLKRLTSNKKGIARLRAMNPHREYLDDGTCITPVVVFERVRKNGGGFRLQIRERKLAHQLLRCGQMPQSITGWTPEPSPFCHGGRDIPWSVARDGKRWVYERSTVYHVTMTEDGLRQLSGRVDEQKARREAASDTASDAGSGVAVTPVNGNTRRSGDVQYAIQEELRARSMDRGMIVRKEADAVSTVRR